MEKFEPTQESLICPWCPSVNGKGILIFKCKHNPFKLMDKVHLLENKLANF